MTSPKKLVNRKDVLHKWWIVCNFIIFSNTIALKDVEQQPCGDSPLQVAALTGRGGGGDINLKRRYGDVWLPRLPFHATPAIHHLKEKCSILPLKANIFRKYGNLLLQKLKLGCNSHQKPENFVKYQFLSPLFDKNPLTRPHFYSNKSAHKTWSLEIMAVHTYQKKVPHPRGTDPSWVKT